MSRAYPPICNALTEASPDSSPQTATYDALGLPQQITDAQGRTTTITLQRLYQITAGGNRISGYAQTYKPAGSSTGQTTTTTYTYDATGALTKRATATCTTQRTGASPRPA